MRYTIFLFLLLPAFLWGQYPNNPRKLRLGTQTTGAGLTYIQSGAPSHTPADDEDAWMVLDTANNVLYYYDEAAGAWENILDDVVRDTVFRITSVPDTSTIVPLQGDLFINATADTLGAYDGAGWQLFVGGGGSGGTTHDTSAYFHRRLTFGTSYTLPSAVLDTADVISIYAGAQTGTSITITLPTLSDTTNDGKIIYVMGSATENGDIMRITSPDSTDILVQGCGAGSVAGPDTITTSYRVLYQYIISSGRYYRTCQRPNVNNITYVPDTMNIDAHQGDMFINSTADTLGLYSGTGWVLFYGGGGSSSIFKQENTSTAATVGSTNNYHTGNLAIGDFSGTTTAADLHLWRTDQAVIRLSDSSATDTAALAWLEFYRGIATNLLGKIGYTDNTDADLYITNSLSGGGIAFGTDAIEKMRLAPSGQLTLNYYGDTTFTGTAVKYLGVTDAGAVIEVDGSSGGSGDSTAFALTQYTADGTTTVDFQSRAGGYFQINMGSTTEDSLTFSNPASSVVPTYRLHWQSVTDGADTVTFPANVLYYNGDTLGSRELAGVFLECYYDGTNYYCSDTLGVPVTVPVGASPATDSTIVTSTQGLIAWYNVNRETEYSDGNLIDTLHDYSGLGHHLAQTTGANQPTYQAGLLNNYPVAQFDGTNDNFSRDSLGELASGNDFTVFAVAKQNGTEANGTVLATLSNAYNADVSGIDYRFALYQDTRAANKNLAIIKTDNGVASDIRTAEADTTHYLNTVLVDFTSGGGTLDTYVNGTQQGTATSWTYSSTSYQNLYLGMGVQFNNSGIPSVPLNGTIAEVIIYNRLLSGSERSNIETYLNQKYNLY